MTAMRPRLSLVTAATIALVSLVFAAPAIAQTTDDLFNGAVLQSMQVTMHSRDWETLRANFTSNDFYPADVTWNGLRVRNVGVRSRGLGSRSGIKPGLELNFAHYSSRSEFLGLKSLVLDNLTTDPSMIRERVAMELMRRLGIPAPREAHAQLYVNGEYAGVYAVVEPVDSTFVARTLGDTRWRTFRRVTLPLSSRGLVAAAVVMWARAVSEFGAIVVITYNPKTVSVLSYDRFTSFGLREALPVAAILTVLALVPLTVLRALRYDRRPGYDGAGIPG